MKRFGVRVYKEYFTFAAAHFLIFPDGGREELHGHNYKVRVRVTGELGAGGMVIDFCRLKPIVRRLCDDLDHRLLLPSGNPLLEVSEDGPSVRVNFTRADGEVDLFVFPRRDTLVVPVANTSTEHLAAHLTGQLIPALRAELGDLAGLETIEIEVEEASGQCGLCAVSVHDASSGEAQGA